MILSRLALLRQLLAVPPTPFFPLLFSCKSRKDSLDCMRISVGTPQVYLPNILYLHPPTAASFLLPYPPNMDLRINKKISLKLGPDVPTILLRIKGN